MCVVWYEFAGVMLEGASFSQNQTNLLVTDFTQNKPTEVPATVRFRIGVHTSLRLFQALRATDTQVNTCNFAALLKVDLPEWVILCQSA
jgi:hypothetical protein